MEMNVVVELNVDQFLNTISAIESVSLDFQILRNRYIKYGAGDSEIDWHWQCAVSDMLCGATAHIPVLPNDWELFRDYKKKWEVACKLTDNLLVMMRLISQLRGLVDRQSDTFSEWEKQYRDKWLDRVSL